MFSYIVQSKFTIPILSFVHGVVLMAIVFLSMMSDYEDGLYDQIVSKTIHAEMSEKEKVLALLDKTYTLLKPRLALFANEPYINARDTWLRSADIQLIDAKGACGSYVHVLARLLQRAGFATRIAQMKCGDAWACHILVEVMVDGRSVTLDPSYNLAFEKPDGSLASFKEVGSHWEKYKSQVPADYDFMYAYDDVRYTNWEKIPVVLPLIRDVLVAISGQQASLFSIRAQLLNAYKTYLVFSAIFYLLLMILTVMIWRRRVIFGNE